MKELPFKFERRSLGTNDSPQADCPVEMGDDLFLLTKSNVGDGELAKIEELAKRRTEEAGGRCGGGFGHENDDVRLAHAIEHITAADLISRKIVTLSQPTVMARTVSVGDENQVLFYVRNGLAPKKEVRLSVRNALKSVKKVLE